MAPYDLVSLFTKIARNPKIGFSFLNLLGIQNAEREPAIRDFGILTDLPGFVSLIRSESEDLKHSVYDEKQNHVGSVTMIHGHIEKHPGLNLGARDPRAN